MSEVKAIRCFCCGVRFDPASMLDEPNWPATEFEAHGNWGSTVYDPHDGKSKLRIRICDACLINNRHAVDEFGQQLPDSIRPDVAEYLATADRLQISVGATSII